MRALPQQLPAGVAAVCAPHLREHCPHASFVDLVREDGLDKIGKKEKKARLFVEADLADAQVLSTTRIYISP